MTDGRDAIILERWTRKLSGETLSDEEASSLVQVFEHADTGLGRSMLEDEVVDGWLSAMGAQETEGPAFAEGVMRRLDAESDDSARSFVDGVRRRLGSEARRPSPWSWRPAWVAFFGAGAMAAVAMAVFVIRDKSSAPKDQLALDWPHNGGAPAAKEPGVAGQTTAALSDAPAPVQIAATQGRIEYVSQGVWEPYALNAGGVGSPLPRVRAAGGAAFLDLSGGGRLYLREGADVALDGRLGLLVNVAAGRLLITLPPGETRGFSGGSSGQSVRVRVGDMEIVPDRHLSSAFVVTKVDSGAQVSVVRGSVEVRHGAASPVQTIGSGMSNVFAPERPVVPQRPMTDSERHELVGWTTELGFAKAPQQRFDFESGTQPKGWETSPVVQCPPRPGNRYCVSADEGDRGKVQAVGIRLSDRSHGIFTYQEGLSIGFDYWIGQWVGNRSPLVEMWIVNRTQQKEYFYLFRNPLPVQWVHAEVSISDFRPKEPADQGRRMRPGDLVTYIAVTTNLNSQDKLFLDNFEVTPQR